MECHGSDKLRVMNYSVLFPATDHVVFSLPKLAYGGQCFFPATDHVVLSLWKLACGGQCFFPATDRVVVFSLSLIHI